MKIYWTDLSKVNEDLMYRYQKKLKSPDVERYARMSDKSRKKQFLIGRMMIYEKCGESPKLTPAGKPVVSNGFISLSHSQNIVILALSDNPVGIDIENKTKIIPFDKIAKRLCFKLDTPDIPLSFYRQFTQYEADFKCDITDPKCHYFFIVANDFIGCVSYPQKDETIEISESIPYL